MNNEKNTKKFFASEKSQRTFFGNKRVLPNIVACLALFVILAFNVSAAETTDNYCDTGATPSFPTDTTPTSSEGSASDNNANDNGDGSNNNGAGGADDSSSRWECGQWSACNAEGISTKICTHANGVTSNSTISCTPNQTTTIDEETSGETVGENLSVTRTSSQTTNVTSGQSSVNEQNNVNEGVVVTIENVSTEHAISKMGFNPLWGIAVLVMLVIVGLGVARYFPFRNKENEV